MTSFFSAEGSPIFYKISLTGAEWHVDCGDKVKIETRFRIPIWRTFGRIQWHAIPETPATFQGVIKFHPPHIENRFSPHFIFLNAVWLWRAAAFVSSPIHVFMHVTRRLELFRSTRLLQSFCICCRCTCHIDTTSCVAFVKYRSSWAPTHGHVAVSYKLSAYDTQNSHNCVA